MENEFGFFCTTMPASRPADYYFGCLDGCIFIDFSDSEQDRIRLTRISFDGYGCCEPADDIQSLSEIDSIDLKNMWNAQSINQARMTEIVLNALDSARPFVWEDALTEYGLIRK